MRVSVPDDVAIWLKKYPDAIPQIRQLIQKQKIA